MSGNKFRGFPDVWPAHAQHACAVPMYMLCHRHEPAECGIAFAAWKGFDSPLRHAGVKSSCLGGHHELWWTVEAENDRAALAQLPPFVAERSHAVRVSEVIVP
jgi:hypothetical protein